MRIVIFIIISLLTACNAVKRVNKDTAKQLAVITNYSKKNPSKNDTTTVFIPGDTIVSYIENVKQDTLYKYVSPSCPPEKTIHKVQKVVQTIRDTTKITITDRSLEKAYQHAANVAEEKTTAMSERANEYKKERNLWRKRFFILLIFSIAAVFITLKFF